MRHFSLTPHDDLCTAFRHLLHRNSSHIKPTLLLKTTHQPQRQRESALKKAAQPTPFRFKISISLVYLPGHLLLLHIYRQHTFTYINICLIATYRTRYLECCGYPLCLSILAEEPVIQLLYSSRGLTGCRTRVARATYRACRERASKNNVDSVEYCCIFPDEYHTFKRYAVICPDPTPQRPALDIGQLWRIHCIYGESGALMPLIAPHFRMGPDVR